jgi:aspartate/glutamate racemase
MPPTPSGQNEYSKYMEQSYRQAVPQRSGRERKKEATENFLSRAQFDHEDGGSTFLFKDSNTAHFQGQDQQQHLKISN